MGAVTKTAYIRPVTPPGYEWNDSGQAKTDIARGDVLSVSTDTPGMGFNKVFAKAATTAKNGDAIALMDAKAGQLVEVGFAGEIDGYSGLTPGAQLYCSQVTAGQIATDTVTGAERQMIALTPTRIKFRF